MAYKLKIIKQKDFKLDKQDHTHYTCAYKGRVFGVSTLKWEGEQDALSVDKSVLTINSDIEVLKRVDHDELAGTTTTYLDIVPKCGIELATF